MTIAEILQDKYTVCHPPYMGDAAEYVTYQLITQTGMLYADDTETETAVMYSIAMYTTNTPFAATVKDIKRRLMAAGWICVVEAEMHEQETGLYHIAMTATTEGEIYG